MKFDIPVSYLRAAILFAAKQDARHWLIGVNLVSHGDSTGLLQATDGHRAVVMRLTGMPIGYKFSAIIPRESVETILKSKGVRKAVSVSVQIAEDMLDYRGAAFTLCEPVSGVTVGGKTIDGVFPDISRVTPKETSGDIAQYNWQYLADCQDAAEILGVSRASESAPIAYNGDGAGIVFLTEDAFALVMPCRKTAPDRAPDWFYPAE